MLYLFIYYFITFLNQIEFSTRILYQTFSYHCNNTFALNTFFFNTSGLSLINVEFANSTENIRMCFGNRTNLYANHSFNWKCETQNTLQKSYFWCSYMCVYRDIIICFPVTYFTCALRGSGSILVVEQIVVSVEV